MNDDIKKQALVKLGELFKACVLDKAELQPDFSAQIKSGIDWIEKVHQQNAWFTPDSVKTALSAWSESLSAENVEEWLSKYQNPSTPGQKVGVIMAGNIPLVGLHDAICVLLSEGHLIAKLSSKDQHLMSWALDCLSLINPTWKDQITLGDNLKGIDVLIATGSDNSSRYFDYYFKDKKKLIRKNRTSIAVLNGNESEEELSALSLDVLGHFGLGCRNVTKLYLPKGFDLDRLFKAFFPFKEIVNHNKYGNNYDYNKAVYLLNQIELIENGFLLLKEDQALHSPVGVLFYEYYNEIKEVQLAIKSQEEHIQCIVGNIADLDSVPFGKAQQPELWDYADGVDTLEFLGMSKLH